MAINWKNVIDDKTKFPDDAKFTIAGEEVTFGELRRQNTESRGELEQQLTLRSAELDRRDQTQRAATDTLARVLENVSQRTGLTYDQLVKGEIPANLRTTVRTAMGETKTDAGIALKDDPLYKPLFESVLSPMRREVDLVKGGLVQAIGAYKNDHTRLAWLDFQMSGAKPEGFKSTYEDVLQHAVNKGYNDDVGFPDVTRAAKELAGPIVQKVDGEKIKKEGFDEGYKKAQAEFAAQLGQPQAGAGPITFDSEPLKDEKTGRPLTIRQQLDKALNDPSITAGLFTVQ